MANVFPLCRIFFVLCNVFIYGLVSGSYFGRDWSVWTKAKRLVEIELSEGRAIGIHRSSELKDFDLFTYGLNYRINPIYMVGSAQKSTDFHIITGNGFLLKNDSLGKIEFEMSMPARAINTCGIVLICSQDSTVDPVSMINISWKTDIKDDYDILARPDNGELFYKLNLKKNHHEQVLFFDTVPAKFFKFVVYSQSGKHVKLRIASINKCRYRDRNVITDCSEKMENNKKFQSQKYGVPISIKCPTDCIRTWPCWGFKIYSTDSPICWTAMQNFGNWGNGEYIIYKVKSVFYFRDQLNPLLNHGIYCRKSIVKFPGYTFDRKYYDFAKKEAWKMDKSHL